MRKLRIIWVAVTLAGCGHSASGPESIDPPSVPGDSGTCTGTVTEYCRLGAGNCPMYQEAVARRSALCSQPGTSQVQTHRCEGLYRSVTWRDFVLGGGDEYFDNAGQLTAAYLVTDYGSAYCGRSFSRTFGAIPVCPGEVVSTSLCAP